MPVILLGKLRKVTNVISYGYAMLNVLISDAVLIASQCDIWNSLFAGGVISV